jgi:hypothetical protein
MDQEEVQHAAFAKAMEIMSSPVERAKFEAESGIDVERFGQQQSREELLAKHSKGLAHIREVAAQRRQDNLPMWLGASAERSQALYRQQIWQHSLLCTSGR